MANDPASILDLLDECSREFTFPILDNGYVYLAASRLSLHYSPSDWALVIEIFGYSPRAVIPDLCVHTFASRLHAREVPACYAFSPEWSKNYLARNANNEMTFYSPISDGEWRDADEPEMVSPIGPIALRGEDLPLPAIDQFAEAGITVRGTPPIDALCRYLAARHRDAVLATPSERRVHVPPELTEILVLEDWHHPNVIEGELPSQTETFQQLARVLSTGDVSLYAPREPANTHWTNWPEGGAL